MTRDPLEAQGPLRRDECFLLIVDLQARLVPAVQRPERVVANVTRLIDAAERVGVPVFATEHCADSIGPTVESVRGRIRADNILPKVHFSAAAEPGVLQRLGALGRKRPVIAGTETHVCVLQTTLGLAAAGYAATIVADAVASRFAEDRETALRRFAAAGLCVVTTEMVIFEWLERADGAAFRDLLPVIKDSPG